MLIYSFITQWFKVSIQGDLRIIAHNTVKQRHVKSDFFLPLLFAQRSAQGFCKAPSDTERPKLETHSVSTGMSKEMNKNKVSYELADILQSGYSRTVLPGKHYSAFKSQTCSGLLGNWRTNLDELYYFPKIEWLICTNLTQPTGLTRELRTEGC